MDTCSRLEEPAGVEPGREAKWLKILEIRKSHGNQAARLVHAVNQNHLASHPRVAVPF
jgi:hypothetical protein